MKWAVTGADVCPGVVSLALIYDLIDVAGSRKGESGSKATGFPLQTRNWQTYAGLLGG
jgi:hypothetical protein